jgi:hypothetical protein
VNGFAARVSNPSPPRCPRPARALRASALALFAVGCSEPDVPGRPELELHVVPSAAVFCMVEPKPPAAPPAPEGDAPPPDAPPPEAPSPPVAPPEVPGAPSATPSPSPEVATSAAPPPPAPPVVASSEPAEQPPTAKLDPKTCAIDCALTCGSPICERQADGTVACRSFKLP